MTGGRHQEQTPTAKIGRLCAWVPGCVKAFGLTVTLATLVLGGCGGKGQTEGTSPPDRSTVRGLAEYVLWTFRIDSIEEFEKVNPPMELVEEWVGKGDPDLPMVMVMAMGMRRDSLNEWKGIRRLAAKLEIDWQETAVVDVKFGEIYTKKISGVTFEDIDGAAVVFETDGKQWWFYLDDLMRRNDGPWYIRDGLKWREEKIRASVRPWGYSTSVPSESSMRELQTDAAKASNVEVNATLDLGKGIAMELVLVPGGKFLMGATMEESRGSSDSPQHEVVISKPFYMGAHEVTQAQWFAVMGSEPWDGKKYTRSGADNAASYISWDDANKFCRTLSKTTGKLVALPTEAQWERACRAGGNTAYCFGDDTSLLGDYAWYEENARDKGQGFAHAVGQKRPNAWGLHGMHGNVWEWCRDWYDASFYATANEADPENTKKARRRVLRGGSFGGGYRDCRSADRDKYIPGYPYYYGFRVMVATDSSLD